MAKMTLDIKNNAQNIGFHTISAVASDTKDNKRNTAKKLNNNVPILKIKNVNHPNFLPVDAARLVARARVLVDVINDSSMVIVCL